MSWPAFLSADAKEGTCYIPPHRFPDVMQRHKPKGQAWRYGNEWTTYCPFRSLTYKNVHRLFRVERNTDMTPKPMNEELFWTVLQEARDAGMNPPTSFGDFFMACYRAPLARYSISRPFKHFAFGGWEAAPRRGEFRGKFRMYDLNSAYRWAASAGLPNPATAYVTRDFTKPSAIYIVELPIATLPYQRGGGLSVVTSEERDAYRLTDCKNLRVLYGMAFRSTVDLAPTFDKIDQQFPSCAKRISRAFWGIWNTTRAPEQVSWKHGENVRPLKNPFYNPVWAAFVTSRVKLRLANFYNRAYRIFVDSILTDEELPTGPEVGAFKLVGEFDSVWIRHAGYWGSGDKAHARSGRRPGDLTPF